MPETALYKQIALVFFSALLLSLSLTPFASRLSLRFGAVDEPDPRKVHRKVVPRLGGLAIVLAMIGTLLLLQPLSRGCIAFLVGAALVSMTGFLDDLFRIRPLYKFFGEILGAAAFVIIGGISLTSFGNLLCTGEIPTAWWGPLVTVVCIVGVMNALNLSDGLDGLAGGISAIACIYLGVFAFLQGDWIALSILVALFGAVLGFLRYNTFPATLFMGDTGSLLLGFSLAAVSVRLAENVNGMDVPAVTIGAVLALPIMDTVYVMTRRLWQRQNPFLPDRSHLHHRLMALGLSHGAVVPILYSATSLFGLLAWAMRGWPEWLQLIAIQAGTAAVHGTVFALQRAGVRFRTEEEIRRPHGRSSRLSYHLAAWIGRSVPAVSWVIGLGLCVPALLPGAVPGRIGLAAFAMACFIAVLFPWRSHRARPGICHGLIYMACVCLLGSLHFIPGTPRWMPAYLSIFSGAVLLWVFVKVKVKSPNRKVILASGFETLLIGATLFVPVVLVPAVGFGEGARNAILMACLESIPLLLALKILIRKQPRRNFVVAASLLAGLLLIGVRGLWTDRPAAASFFLPGESVAASAGKPASSALPSVDPLSPPSKSIR